MNNQKRKLIYSCASDAGRFRKKNQDNFVCDGIYMTLDANTDRFSFAGSTESAGFHLFGVFDGMGGEECGEVAAFLAAKEAASFHPQHLTVEELKNLCYRINQIMCDYTEEKELFSMGTTAALLALSAGQLCICNIGDSKIFRFDGTSLKQLSVDHLSSAPVGMKRPLSQNLGIPADIMVIDPYVSREDCRNGDLFLICSDGLTDMVGLREMWKIVTTTGAQELSGRLVERALKKGGRDNVTVLSVKVEG